MKMFNSIETSLQLSGTFAAHTMPALYQKLQKSLLTRPCQPTILTSGQDSFRTYGQF
jgi:hypothetical protein